jgi:type I restriction enzyme S subunit
MRSQWPKVRIDELCERMVDCLNRTAPAVVGPTEFKMIRTTNVRGGWIDFSDVKYVDEPTYRKWTRRERPRRGDIVLTREAPLGEVGMIRTNDAVFLGQRTALYRANPCKLDGRYLLYVLQGQDLQQQIRAFGSGSTVEHMRVPDAKELLIPCPNLQAQARIGEVLGSIDDLIENNTRRVAILEEMARRVFEEWFVHFHAPGCEGLPMVDSAIGSIPQGWEKSRLDAVIDFDPTVHVEEGVKPFIPMTSLSTASMIIGDVEQRDGRSGAKFLNGDTLLARITPCLENGKTGLVDFLNDREVGCGSTKFIVMRGRKVPPTFVQLLARSHRFRDHAVGSMSGATGRQRVRRESLAQFEIVLPPSDILIRFDDLISPKFNLARVLANQNSNLRAQRGLLLPKLISGEIEVSSPPAPLEEAAE